MTAIRDFVLGNWVAIVIGFVGIAATIGVYLFTRSDRRPCWSAHTVDLVTKSTAGLRGLQITFNGRPVSDLSVSRIVLFNAGREPIRRQDIAPAAPLALEVPADVTMLDANLVAVNNKVNRVSLQFDAPNNRALVDFDFLSRGEGAVFDVVHYGGGQPTAKVAGVVIGARLGHLAVAKPDRSSRFMSWLAGALSISAAYYVLQQIVTKGLDWVDLVLVVAFVFLPGALFVSQLTQPSVPTGLEAFHERGYRSQAIGKGASSAGPS